MKQALGIITLCIVMISCNKEPGEGGKAEIRGRLLERQVFVSGVVAAGPYPVIGDNVYIVYGDGADGQFPDDNVDSGPNGEFRFRWLRKGTYTVYAVGDSYTTESGKTAVPITITIDDRKGVVEIGDLIIDKIP